MTGKVLLSVIIVEYHCPELVKGCLSSLNAHLNGLDWECIVVSNSVYPDIERERIAIQLDGVHIIFNERNAGYAGGVNRGLPECRGEFVFILNPDSRLTDDRVPVLIGIFEEFSDIAVIGPRVVDMDNNVQPSCRRFPKPWSFILIRGPLRHFSGSAVERRRYLGEDLDHNQAQDVDWVSGGAMLIRKAAISDVGPMDERYFLYMEDVDWCRQFWRAGWRVRYAPVCTVCHEGQHESIRGSLKSLTSKHFWFHMSSLAKYLIKWASKE